MITSRRRTFRVNTKFYLFMALIAAAAGLTLYMMLRTESAVVREGSLQFTASMPVVVVRDEEVITTESYEKVNFLVPDLQRVEADTPVAEIFRWGYNERVMNDVIDVQNQIEEYERRAGALSEDVRETEASISEVTDEIRQIANGAEGDMIAAERRLNTLMDQKRQLLADGARRDSQLTALYDQEQQLLDRVNSWREISNAPQAGVVSYYYDGYERVINADNIRNVSADIVNALISGTLEVQTDEEDTARPIYRLVDNFSWYVVLEPRERVLEFANDNTFTVVFADFPERRFEGRIIGNVSEGSTYLYVMEFAEDIGQLINTRRAQATLSAAFDGLIVPERAIVESGGQQGVYVMENKVRSFVPVNVRIVQDGEAVVETLDGSTRLQAGSRVVW
ncbi:MAG: hypothetical protein HDQ87_10385 [Clostridia bacterium]|nr:hypothetical protein [Clostridia bacterium]